MKRLTLMFLMAFFANPFINFEAGASELDPVSTMDKDVPQGLVVHITADGRREVFKATLNEGVVEDDAAAEAVLLDSLKEENLIESVAPLSELDQVSSDESWNWAWNAISTIGGYFNYGYYNHGRNYNYYPSHSYYRGRDCYNYYYNRDSYRNYYDRGHHRDFRDNRRDRHHDRNRGWR
ncbi:MAG: hypothetical protein HQK50_06615 [Oligoflexia bacterium]|nr:hypothetical protein [Oligoflexia bacterium]MBF0365225.1 hypothetical protein [Oligoflexia bacterium]